MLCYNENGESMEEQMSTCRWCGNEVCIFLQFEADIVGLRQWHQRAAALGTNRERRKMAF